ncbi:MAG: hypothetical protein HUU50_06875 [Candidatus Brocadiae bacterium]|nr:hypothetical protein [Candidatus Brocadiia bacterium]
MSLVHVIYPFWFAVAYSIYFIKKPFQEKNISNFSQKIICSLYAKKKAGKLLYIRYTLGNFSSPGKEFLSG